MSKGPAMKNHAPIRLAIFSICLLALSPGARAGEFLAISNGYFSGRTTGAPFVPRGFAYQVFNPAVYATQSFEQIAYDLTEMKTMRANSLRAEFVWGEVETSEGVFDFSKTDFLVQKAEELGLNLFVLIGYQYPPYWLASSHPDRLGVHYDPNTSTTGTSDVLNYAHPAARAAYSNYIAAVCAHYKDSTAIGGWILGNEFAFYDLWEDPNQWPTHRYLGFDSAYSRPSFQNYLQSTYGTIAALNSMWGTAHAAFTNVPMPVYPGNRTNHTAIRQSGYHDVLQWRARVIGDFIGAGASAAKAADPNHLTTYSMVGGIFNGLDANITCEDARTIVQRCQAAGAPLDFWSINNYPWTLTGSEMRSTDFGISRYKEQTGLPVVISETGLSSTDSLFIETPARQAGAEASLMWESLMSGAIGVHLFHWSDRDAFLASGSPFDREAGFGIVKNNRLVKNPVYWNIMLALLRMEDIQIDKLLAGSRDPRPDVLTYWSHETDLGYNRYNQDFAMTWAAFKRLGYQIGFLDEQGFDAGAWTSAAAIYLPRNFQMEPGRLDALETQIISNGISVHAAGDLPGQFDSHHRSNTNWVSRMSSIFGLNAASATPGWDAGSTNNGAWPSDYQNIDVYIQSNFAPLAQSGTPTHFGTWKIWHGLTASSGITIATQTGKGGNQPASPALQIKNHGVGKGKTAINTFAMGDIIAFFADGNPPEHVWNVHSDFLKAVYGTHFGITPTIRVSGTGASRIAADYRNAGNGSRLISLLNMSASGVYVNVEAPALMNGCIVEDLTHGNLLTRQSTGTVAVGVGPDEFVLLYAYTNNTGSAGNSLDNPESPKIWITDGPMRVWPNDELYPVQVRYDTAGQAMKLQADLIQYGSSNVRYGLSQTFTVSGSGIVTATVPASLFLAHDSSYVSTPEGGNYRLRAVLIETNGFTQKFGQSDLVSSFEGLPRGAFIAPSPWLGNSYGDGSQQYLINGVDDIASHGTNGTFHIYQSHTNAGGFSGFYFTYTFTNPPTLPEDLSIARFGFDFRETNGRIAMLEMQIKDTSNQLSTITKSYSHSSVGFDSFEANLTQFTGIADPRQIKDIVVLIRMLATNAEYVAHLDNIRFASGQVLGYAAETHVPVRMLWGLRPDDLPVGPQIETGTIYNLRALWDDLPSYIGSEFPTPLSRADVWPVSHNDLTEQYRVEMSLLDPYGVVVTSAWQLTSIGATSMPFSIRTPNTLTNSFYQWRGEIISAGSSQNLLDSFEDRTLGNNNATLIAPWFGYSYAQGTTPTLLDEGIGTAHTSDGSKSAFRVVFNSPAAGSYSGFGYIYTFGSSVDLFSAAVRSNVWLSFDFREADGGHACVLELQVKDVWGNTVNFTKPYVHPGASGLDTIGATLNQFTTNFAMDWQNVKQIAMNIQMQQLNANYAGIFDDVQFLGTPLSGGGHVRAVYSVRITHVSPRRHRAPTRSAASPTAPIGMDKVRVGPPIRAPTRSAKTSTK